MKILLWISRHEPNKAQIDHIVNKIGEVEVVGLNKSTKEEIKKYISIIKPDCIVAIVPRTWFSYLLRGVPKSIIFLKPKCKSVHPGESREELCKDFDLDSDILLDPRFKRYEEYITKGDNIIHLRHSGYERIILVDKTLLFINWK